MQQQPELSGTTYENKNKYWILIFKCIKDLIKHQKVVKNQVRQIWPTAKTFFIKTKTYIKFFKSQEICKNKTKQVIVAKQVKMFVKSSQNAFYKFAYKMHNLQGVRLF